jgi:hypothetical protein
MLKQDEDLNVGNESKSTNTTKSKISSKEVLNLVIELLRKRAVTMNYKQIFKCLSTEGYAITEGQILNVQNKVKANKVAELRIVYDENGRILMSAGKISSVVYDTINLYFAKAVSSIKTNFNDLSDEDKRELITKLNNNTKKLINYLKTAKQS